MARKKKTVEKVEGVTPFSGKRGFELHPCYSISVKGRKYNFRNLTDKAAEEYLSAGGGSHVFKSTPSK